MQLGQLRRPPAPLAGDDLEHFGTPRGRPHQDGLQHALFPDRVGEILQLLGAEILARLERIGMSQPTGSVRGAREPRS